MASGPKELGDTVDDFLISRGHENANPDWLWDGKKKQCPECFGLHPGTASECTVCGWVPR